MQDVDLRASNMVLTDLTQPKSQKNLRKIQQSIQMYNNSRKHIKRVKLDTWMKGSAGGGPHQQQPGSH